MIRIAGAHDVEPAVEVWRATLAAQGRRPSATALHEVTAQVSHGLLVVAEEKQLIGMAVGNPAAASDLELQLVCVVPDRQRRGIGTALVEALADAAWERGLRTMSASTDDTSFLEAIGFQAADGKLTAELEAPVRDVLVKAEGIRLGQLMKLAELVETGAEAKALLADEAVDVNGEIETRRGRQLVSGDVVRAREQAVRVVTEG